MAVVAFTAYTCDGDCARTNTYVSDGHGAAPAARSNRYISDGHGGHTQCLGHLCPSDPVLATAYMQAKRWNYERQHTVNPERKKGRVTHIQLYVSPTEADQVPPEERLEMTRELIERTVLREFPSIYIAHDNTPQGHCHISLCPFSEDGTHKLCMNNKRLYDLRREMDRICTEHGYSIIESPELWGDKTYRDWFFAIKEQGIVTIHPPREQDRSFSRREGKRARDYALSKQAQLKRKEKLEAWCRELTKGYSPEKDEYFYTSPWLYNPTDPTQPLRIKGITQEGKWRSELELNAAALGAWAYHCEERLKQKAIPGTEQLQKRLHTMMNRAYASKQLIETLDIRDQEELVFHIKECGQDIGTLKRYLRKQESELEKLRPLMQAVERWEGERDPEAFQYLQSQEKESRKQMAQIKEQHTRILARKESYQKLLEERSREYRHLKEVEKTLHPISCKIEWEAYLSVLFSKNVAEQAKWISADALRDRIYELGNILGIPEETMDRYLEEVENDPGLIRSREYRAYRNQLFAAQERERRGYARYCSGMDALEDLWKLRNKLEGFGLLGFLLSVVVETVLEMNQSISQMELSAALWDAGLERWYAKCRWERVRKEIPYHPEVQEKIMKERQEAARRIQERIWEATDFDREHRNEKPLPKRREIARCASAESR